MTPNHPYLRPSDVIGKGVLELVKMDPGGDWTAVLKLKPGDELVSALGIPLVVDTIDVDDEPTRVYSLEVEGLHSFAVGELAAWVHNDAKPGKPKPGSSGGDGAGKPFPDSVRQQMLEFDPCKTCVYCGLQHDDNHLDHVIPKSKGGNNTIKNAQWACCHCNCSKRDREKPVTDGPGPKKKKRKKKPT